MTNKDFFKDKNNKFFDVTLIVDKEDELKHISKSALFHNIVILQEQLDEITQERDLISKENDRLFEENQNLELLASKK